MNNIKNDSLYLDFRKSYMDYHQTTGGYLSYWRAIESIVKEKFRFDVKVVYININRERLDGYKTFYGSQE